MTWAAGMSEDATTPPHTLLQSAFIATVDHYHYALDTPGRTTLMANRFRLAVRSTALWSDTHPDADNAEIRDHLFRGLLFEIDSCPYLHMGTLGTYSFAEGLIRDVWRVTSSVLDQEAR